MKPVPGARKVGDCWPTASRPWREPNSSGDRKEPWQAEPVRGLRRRESLWAHSPAQRGPAQHPSPSLGWLLNEPSCSLMHPLSVRLSGEDMERENALGYQYNLSWGHQISTCRLCPVLHLCPEGCPSATTYTGRVPTGERVMDLLLRLPRPWTLPQLRGPRAFPWILREISTSFWERDLRRVSIFFSIHSGLKSMETQDYITN